MQTEVPTWQYKESEPFLARESLQQPAIFEIANCLKPEINQWGREDFPVRIKAQDGSFYRITLWQRHINELIKAFGKNPLQWIGKHIKVEAVQLKDVTGNPRMRDGKILLGWSIAPSDFQSAQQMMEQKLQ